MPRAPKPGKIVVQTAAFPEPDHTPEHTAQRVYEARRDNNPFLGVDDAGDPPGLQCEDEASTRLPGAACGVGCPIPSHQQWFMDQYPGYTIRDIRADHRNLSR